MSYEQSYPEPLPGLNIHSSILAVVCHYQREHWLAQCIESLVSQTRPPDNIVVVDDASPEPPLEIVRRFPGVTLLAARQNVGMLRLVQNVVASTGYDAYMFQDSDDWSAPQRLAAELSAAEVLGAEMAGCQEHRIYQGIPPESRVEYPLDCNLSLCVRPAAYPILFPSSIASRRLIQRIGGFATGLRYSADAEFIRRAVFVSRIISIPQTYYYRRIHPAAATRHSDTGMGSPLRESLRSRMMERWDANCARFLSNQELDVSPLAVEAPVALHHLCGPELQPAAATPHGEGDVGALTPELLALMRMALKAGESAAEVPRLKRQLAEMVPETARLRYELLAARVRARVLETIPPGSVVAVVSKGDSALMIREPLTTLHFPQDSDGAYTGYHPAGDEEAVRYVEAAQARGAAFLVFPETAFWWLDHYPGLRAHLDARGRRVCGGDDCVIYSLGAAEPKA